MSEIESVLATTRQIEKPLQDAVGFFLRQQADLPEFLIIKFGTVLSSIILEADHQARVDGWFIKQRKIFKSLETMVEKLKKGVRDSQLSEDRELLPSNQIGCFVDQIRNLKVPISPFSQRFTVFDMRSDEHVGTILRTNILLAVAADLFSAELLLKKERFREVLIYLHENEILKKLGYALKTPTVGQIQRVPNDLRHQIDLGDAVVFNHHLVGFCVHPATAGEPDLIFAERNGKPAQYAWFKFYGNAELMRRLITSYLSMKRY